MQRRRHNTYIQAIGLLPPSARWILPGLQPYRLLEEGMSEMVHKGWGQDQRLRLAERPSCHLGEGTVPQRSPYRSGEIFVGSKGYFIQSAQQGQQRHRVAKGQEEDSIRLSQRLPCRSHAALCFPLLIAAVESQGQLIGAWLRVWLSCGELMG